MAEHSVNRNERIIATNKKARYDYFIEEVYQAGISLAGTEVKSLRAGRCNLTDSYVAVGQDGAFVEGMHISAYEHGNIFNKDPVRRRRLLLHKYEINKLRSAVTRQGYTIIPTRVYFVGGKVKVDVAVAKGKKQYDKREEIAKKTQRREAEREFRQRMD